MLYILKEDNIHQAALQERIQMLTKYTFLLQKFLNIKILSKKLKLRLKNIIDKTLTYA
jgi:hypothetical protein